MYVYVYVKKYIYIYTYMYMDIYIFWFQVIQTNHTVNLLINADRQFKVLLANYICSNWSKFPPKNH